MFFIPPKILECVCNCLNLGTPQTMLAIKLLATQMFVNQALVPHSVSKWKIRTNFYNGPKHLILNKYIASYILHDTKLNGVYLYLEYSLHVMFCRSYMYKFHLSTIGFIIILWVSFIVAIFWIVKKC